MQKKDKRFLKLKYWRQKLNITQDEMGILLGYKKACYCQKENGNVKFYLQEAITILDAFNKRLKKLGQDQLKLEDIFLD